MSPTDVTTEGADRRTADGADAEDSVERALAAFRAGDPVCVHDFDDRECETDLIYPAEAVDADAVARMRNDAGGLVCLALPAGVADAADLPYFADAIDHPAVGDADLGYDDRSSFSLTVNHRDTYTGVTDEDRALTITELAAFVREVETNGDDGDDAPRAFADRFRVPGHVHLLRGAPDLLADRQGHTELGLALARAAGVTPAVVVCEMLDDASGGARSTADAREYADRNGFPFLRGDSVLEALD